MTMQWDLRILHLPDLHKIEGPKGRHKYQTDKILFDERSPNSKVNLKKNVTRASDRVYFVYVFLLTFFAPKKVSHAEGIAKA